MGPLLSSGSSQAYIVCSRWSPSRPGVFFITRSDGTLEIWDLLDMSHVPSSVQSICASAISYLSIHQYPCTYFFFFFNIFCLKNRENYLYLIAKSTYGHQFIAAGDDEGTLHILEVPKSLCKPVRNEKSILSAFFDREVKRLQYVQDRKKTRGQDKVVFDAAIQEALAAVYFYILYIKSLEKLYT
jgi:hypothetical protein